MEPPEFWTALDGGMTMIVPLVPRMGVEIKNCDPRGIRTARPFRLSLISSFKSACWVGVSVTLATLPI